MPEFQYEAISTSGKTTSGRYKAEVVAEVEQWLAGKGLAPIAIETVSDQDRLIIFNTATDRQQPSMVDKLKGVPLDDLILLCRQIATMLDAGVTVLQALNIMAGQVSNNLLRQILAQAGADIESGSSLSEALAGYPRVFNKLFLNVLQVGEESGSLDRSFSYLATLYENEKDIAERIKTATRYPKIVISAIFVAVFILMTFVVPKFAQLFASSKVALPMPTRVLIATSGFFANYYLLIILFLAGTGFIYHQALKYEKVVNLRDRLLLKIPIFGDLSIKIYMSRFCRVFAVLTKSGINIIKTLQLSAMALDNRVLFSALEQVIDDVEGGMELHLAMSRFPIFPSMVVQMVAVGEESGQVDQMMDKVANYFDAETNYLIKNLSTLIEPFLLFFLGIMVGFIALSIFLPMWNIMNVVR